MVGWVDLGAGRGEGLCGSWYASSWCNYPMIGLTKYLILTVVLVECERPPLPLVQPHTGTHVSRIFSHDHLWVLRIVF